MPHSLSTTEQRIKAATKDLQRAVGGVEAAAEISGKSKSQHGRFQSPHDPDFATIADVIAMERVAHGTAGHPQVTRLLCAQAGGLFVPLPEAIDEGDGLSLLACELAAEVGDVARAVSDSLRDRVVEPGEARHVLRELDDMDAKSAALRLQLVRILEGEGPDV